VIGKLRSNPPLGLALQGGGAHGAYTWGVLDALLERTNHPIAAISGTSAGAVNAVVLAHGLMLGGRDGAREALNRFWTSMGAVVPWSALGLVANDGERFTAAGRLMMRWAQSFSPSLANPMRVDPLRELLQQQVDFERLRHATAPRLHVAATHANNGRLRVFDNDELSVDAVLASACLPLLQPAITIDGEPYWDGAYSANPALFPLVRDRAVSDIVLIVLSPWHFGETPESLDEIRMRATEIAFNASFLREMHWLAEATALARRAWWPGPLERRLRRVHWHMIDGHDVLSALPADSKVIAHPTSLTRMRDAGRVQSEAWLVRVGPSIGRRDSADLERMFGHHLPAPSPD
jgi:NTE family protein